MKPSITVIGLGPGGSGDITEASVAALRQADRILVRTERHPTVERVRAEVEQTGAELGFFDQVYNEADAIEDVYRTIADQLVSTAADGRATVYAVPGSPLVLERSVAHLRNDERVDIKLVPSLSFLDVAWARLGIDPIEERVRLIDGHTFAADAAGDVGPMLVAHTHAAWVLSDIKLAIDADDSMKAIVLQRLGTDDEHIFEVPWSELDQAVEADHLTSIFLPAVAAPVAGELMATVNLMHRLRSECPWDQEQTHESLRRHLIEETYEVVEAIDDLGADPSLDDYAHLEEELGDLWFQILFHAELATEAGAFSVADVARTVHDKLVSRHPHVFGDVEAADAAAVLANWETNKMAEKQRESVMDGIPPALPSLALAEKILKKASRLGIPAPDAWVEEQLAIANELSGSAGEAELGHVLFGIVERARTLGLDPDRALRSAALAVRDRVRDAEVAGTKPAPWITG